MTDLENLRQVLDGSELSDSDLAAIAHQAQDLSDQAISQLTKRSLRKDRTYQRRIKHELESLGSDEIAAAKQRVSSASE